MHEQAAMKLYRDATREAEPPPHSYAVAESVYRALVRRKAQLSRPEGSVARAAAMAGLAAINQRAPVGRGTPTGK